MKKALILVISFFAAAVAEAQLPVINNVTPLNTYTRNRVVITGSGFSSTISQMQVWFDQVKGDIKSASEFTLEVEVPPQARLSNIEVTNLSSRLSAKTNIKFLPYFNGSSFDPAKFSPVASFSTGFDEANDVCTCDMDGDGKPDMAATRNGSSATLLMLYKNNSTPGSINFTALTAVNVGAPMINITCADLNGDGKPELISNRGGGTRNEIFVFRNTSVVGTISFAAPTKLIMEVGHNAFRVITRDLNADGRPEVIVSNASDIVNNPIYVFVNQSSAGNIAFSSTPTKVSVTGANATYGLDSQDLDGDGKPEIILNQFNNPNIFILKNGSTAGSISFTSTIKIDLPGTYFSLTTGDFNNDGKEDIAVTKASPTKEVVILTNQSTSTSISFSAPVSLTPQDTPFGIDVADIDGDKDADIIVGNFVIDPAIPAASREVSVFLNNGSGTFTKSSVLSNQKFSRNVKVGDLDGDSKPDIAFTTVTGNSVDIVRNTNCFQPQILNVAPLKICSSQTITLTSIPNNGATFDWKNSANTSLGTAATLAVTAPETYTLTATSESGACVKSASIVVSSGLGSVPSVPTIQPVNPVCLNQTLNLQTTDVAAGYSWTGPNNFTSTQQNPSIPNITSANAGAYTLQLTSADGCKSDITTKSVDVVNLANFVVSSPVPSNQVCSGASVTLSVNTASGHTYQWIKDGTDLSGQTNSTLAVTQDGAYKVRVTNTTLGCSIETSALAMTVLALPVASFTSSTAATCINNAITFTSTTTADSRATVAYAWDFGDGSTSTVQNPSKTYTTVASRNVTLTASYSGLTGCSNTSAPKTITVSTAQVPVINATANPICTGETSVLSVTGTFTSYAWTGPATGSTATLNITAPGTYIVNTTESNGCTGTAQLIVTTKNGFAMSVTANGKPVDNESDLLVAAGVPVQLQATGADTYSWAPPDGLDDPAIANPKATPTLETSYTVTGKKVNFCDAVLTFNMKFDAAGNNFSPPNAFSPNGDTINDLWIIPGAQNYSDCTLSIFTKQGSKVFEQKGYTNNWDGTYEGKELPQGTYYYVLTCPDQKPVTGHVLLAR